LAISKERKQELVDQYKSWAEASKGMFVTDYIGLSTKEMDELRGRVREAGGEFHIVKNTLTKIAFQEFGLDLPEDLFVGTSAIGFAFEDAPSVAKAISEFAKESEFVKVKGGFLGKETMSEAEIDALGNLPPLPVLRAQILGTIMAPASKLTRLIGEPGRQVAQVIKAYAEQDGAAEPA
jgi:large subunit ribosomal protein L10